MILGVCYAPWFYVVTRNPSAGPLMWLADESVGTGRLIRRRSRRKSRASCRLARGAECKMLRRGTAQHLSVSTATLTRFPEAEAVLPEAPQAPQEEHGGGCVGRYECGPAARNIFCVMIFSSCTAV